MDANGATMLHASDYASYDYPYSDNISVAADATNLYVAWVERFSSSDSLEQVHVAKYDGTNWTVIGGLTTTAGLNYDSAKAARYTAIAADNGKLYVVWNENAGSGSRLHVKYYNGSSWSFIDGGAAGLNYNTNVYLNNSPDITIFNGEPYVSWDEPVAGINKIRVKKYSSGSWVSLDGSGSEGLNYNASVYAHATVLASDANKLYLGWNEAANSKSQFRVLSYNAADGWSHIDADGISGGGDDTGINMDYKNSFSFNKDLATGDGKLCAIFSEYDASYIGQIQFKEYDPDFAIQANSDRLSGLTLSTGTLYPVFNPSTYNYTILTDKDTSSVNVTITLADSYSKIYYNGSYYSSGSTFTFNGLQTGDNNYVLKLVTFQASKIEHINLCINRAVSATQRMFYPKADSYYDYYGYYPLGDDLTYPGENINWVGYDNNVFYSENQEAVLKFDYSFITDTITAASLGIKIKDIIDDRASENPYASLYGSNDNSWTVDSADPPSSDVTIITRDTAGISAGSSKTFDVYSYVQGKRDNIATFVLKGNAEGNSNCMFSFYSAENATDKPYLLLIYNPSDTTPPTLSSTSASDITGTTAKINFTSDEAGTYYYVVYAAAAAAPDADTVKAQGDAVAKGTSALTANTAKTIDIIGLTEDTAYKAYVIAEDAAGNKSSVTAISFTTIATTATPVIGTPAGAVLPGTEVTLTCTTAGANIYYTTNGDTPTSSSNRYTGTIRIDAPLTLKAIAVKSGWESSSVASASYTIPATVEVINSEQFKNCIESQYVSTINLVSGTEYSYGGIKLNRSLRINGNGATIIAGTGVSDDLLKKTGGATTNGRTFLAVEGTLGNISSLVLNNVTLINSGALHLAVINGKSFSSLSLDCVTFDGFYANPPKTEEEGSGGAVNNFGVHAEPGCLSTTVTSCVFGSTNAIRNAVAIRGGAALITDNTFTGTAVPQRLNSGDSYEYAVFLYGGDCTVTDNVISGYDSWSLISYASGGIAACPYAELSATIRDNILSGNSNGLSFTGAWSSYSNPARTNINISETAEEEYVSLTSSANAFKIGEALRSMNTFADNPGGDISLSLDQNDHFTNTDGVIYWSSGYFAPFLTLTETETDTATVAFGTDSVSQMLIANSNNFVIEFSDDGGETWAAAETLFRPEAAEMVFLDPDKTYKLRAAITIISTIIDENGIESSTGLTCYSNSVDVILKPNVTSVSPSYGPPAGGTSVTITGENLSGATEVKFGTVAAAFTAVSPTQLTATSPAHAAGVVNITVTTPGGTSAAGTENIFLYNSAPTDITLNISSVNENSAIGTIVGTLQTTDADSGDTFTYSLVSGDGDTDNAGFTIDVNSLKLNTVPDYETKNSYSIRVKTTDSGGLTYAKTFTITITDVNEVPGVTSAAAADFAENGTGTAYTVTGSDVDAGTTLTYNISGADAALFNINTETGAVTFKSAPDYEDPKDANKNNAYAITVTVSDGTLTASQDVTITVTNVNEAPGVTSAATADFAENGTGTAYTVTGSDVDADTTLTYNISGEDAALFNIDSATGAVTFKSAPDYEDPKDADTDNAYEITVTVSDGTLTASQNVTITVTNVNEAPGVTSAATADFAENGTGTAYTVTGSDVDAGTTLTYNISGADAALFNIDSATGAVTFKSAPDYEDPKDADTDNAYEITVTVSDGTLSASKNVTIIITDVNEVPVINTNRALSLLEDAPSASLNTYLLASDVDTVTLTYTVTEAPAKGIIKKSGTAAGSFTQADIDSGYVTYTPNENANGTDSFRFTVSDGSLTTAETTFNITITPVNDIPVFTAGADQTVLEDCGAQSVQWAEDIYSIRPNTNPALFGAPGVEPDDESGQTVWFEVFNDNTDLFSAQPAIAPDGTLTYTPAPNAFGSATVTAVLKDDGGTANGGADTSEEVSFTITVTPVNDAPTANNTSVTTDEDTAFTGSLVNAAYDIDCDTLAYTAVTNPSHGTLSLAADGSFNYTPAKDYNGNDSFTWRVSDGELDSNTSTVSIMVNAVNGAPVIMTEETEYTYLSDTDEAVFTPVCYDIEGETVTWSISGADAALFTIDAATGELEFKDVPSYYRPIDSDNNNIYELTLTASDGQLTDTLAVRIQVYSAKAPASDNNDDNTNKDDGAEVLVNGESQKAGELTVNTDGTGKTSATVTVDAKKLQAVLDSKESGAVVTVPVTGDHDVANCVLTGEMIMTMEETEATLVIKTDLASYTIPASEINIGAVSEMFGTEVTLSDIKVSIEIAKPDNEKVQLVEDTANKGSFTIVVPPVEFNIICTYNGREVEVSRFNAYVERMIPIPDGVDPSKITTGVVLNDDGTVSHVPTVIVEVDGKYYAKINSLTNSTYSVIWHPIEFRDVEAHWARDSVNNMGSRLIVNGTADGIFEPDRDITRAEFAAIMVRALGLRQGDGSSGFTDVAEHDWYNGYIKTAVEYGLIKGFEDGSFKPEDSITREQAMAIIARAMKLTKLESGLGENEAETLLAGFADGSEASVYARESIAGCIKAGLVSGRANSRLAPKDYITRAEAAVIVERLLVKSELINLKEAD